ncbi:MAG: hypothetical protein JSU86_00585 [Phycisphaerales bacterium]|nr:MAG: hypothetical protein JSU86_00585 [Phycisphaerales bacterium]
MKWETRRHARVKTTTGYIWLLAVMVPNTAFPGPTFEGLGDLPGGFCESEAWGISEDGITVAGWSWSGDPDLGDGPLGFEAMRWDRDTGIQGLGGLPGRPDSRALDVAASGTVVVGWARWANNTSESRAFRWTDVEGMTDLGVFSSDVGFSIAAAVSSDGNTVVGWAREGTSGVWQAFRWRHSTGMQHLTGMPSSPASVASDISADSNVIVGRVGNEPYRWTEDLGPEFLGVIDDVFAETREGVFVSGDGSTIVGSAVEAGTIEPRIGFRWTRAEGFVLLPLPSFARGVHPQAVSYDGSVVVGYTVDDNEYYWVRPFIWDNATGIRNLKDVLIQEYGLCEVAAWSLGYGRGVSADGRSIVGAGVNPDGNGEAWLARLPEPGAAILLADLDGDDAVDLDDFLEPDACLCGPDATPQSCPPEAFADLDCDGDQDLADFARFQVEFTGGM